MKIIDDADSRLFSAGKPGAAIGALKRTLDPPRREAAQPPVTPEVQVPSEVYVTRTEFETAIKKLTQFYEEISRKSDKQSPITVNATGFPPGWLEGSAASDIAKHFSNEPKGPKLPASFDTLIIDDPIADESKLTPEEIAKRREAVQYWYNRQVELRAQKDQGKSEPSGNKIEDEDPWPHPNYGRGVTSYDVSVLDVVGYGDLPDKSQLPAIVPPIFRLRTKHQVVLVPPYKLDGNLVVRAKAVSIDEARALHRGGELWLRVEPPFAAKPDHALWINTDGKLLYEPTQMVRSQFAELHAAAVTRAKNALAANHVAVAEDECSAAILTDSTDPVPFAMKAAIRRKKRIVSGERIMKELGYGLMDTESFDALVDHYAEDKINVGEARAEGIEAAVSNVRGKYNMHGLLASVFEELECEAERMRNGGDLYDAG